MVHHSPVVLGTKLAAREDDRVERNIVFTHELIELDIIGVLPPLFPLLGVACCNAGVSNRSIIPDIEHLVLETGHRNRSTPLEITSNATGTQAFLQPRLGNVNTVGRPLAYQVIHKYISSLSSTLNNIPSTLTRALNFSISPWRRSKSKKMCFESLVMGRVPSNLQRGSSSSVAFNKRPQESHWSPRASYTLCYHFTPIHKTFPLTLYLQLGQTPST